MNNEITEHDNDEIKIIDINSNEENKNVSNKNTEEKETHPELEKLIENNQTLQTKVKEYYQDYLRSLADLENYKKRAEKEKINNLKFGQELVLRELIELGDDFSRGKKHFLESNNQEEFIEGLNIIEDKLSNILSNYKIAPFGEVDENFDPKIHEAIASHKVSEIEKDNKIAIIIKKGYKFGEKLLRPAQVIVGMYNEQDQNTENNDNNNLIYSNDI